MNSTTLNMQVVRLVAAIGAFLVLALILAVILAAILRGVSLDNPQLAQLITSIGVLLTLAVALAGTSVAANGVAKNTEQLGSIQGSVEQVNKDVNGHLAAHAQLSPDNMEAMIRKAVQDELAAHASTQEKPA